MPERSILAWLAIGLVTGVVAKLLPAYKEPGGFVVTILFGIAGALLAGFVAETMQWTSTGTWQNYAVALGGAIVLLSLYRTVVSHRLG